MRAGVAAAIAMMLAVSHASAQGIEEPLSRFYVAAGGGAFGGTSFGSADANLRTNATTEQPYRLFSADSSLSPAPVLDVALGMRLARRIAVEAGVKFGRPELRTALSADAESAAPLTVVERIDQYLIDGTVVVRIDELRMGRRTVPFVAAGAGYLRQLHEGSTVIEEGHLYHVGAGVRHWLSLHRAGIRGIGVRGEVRLYVLNGGINFVSDPRPRGAASGSIVLAF